MKKLSNEWLEKKRVHIEQLLDEGNRKYSRASKKDSIAETLAYRHYLSHSEQGKEVLRIIKEVSEMIEGRYPFQVIVCDHYEDYLEKVESINKLLDFHFEHDWEGSYNQLDDPIILVVYKEHLEIYSIDETRDLLNLESRINEVKDA